MTSPDEQPGPPPEGRTEQIRSPYADRSAEAAEPGAVRRRSPVRRSPVRRSPARCPVCGPAGSTRCRTEAGGRAGNRHRATRVATPTAAGRAPAGVATRTWNAASTTGLAATTVRRPASATGLAAAAEPATPGLAAAAEPATPGLAAAAEPATPGLAAAAEPATPGLESAADATSPGLAAGATLAPVARGSAEPGSVVPASAIPTGAIPTGALPASSPAAVGPVTGHPVTGRPVPHPPVRRDGGRRPGLPARPAGRHRGGRRRGRGRSRLVPDGRTDSPGDRAGRGLLTAGPDGYAGCFDARRRDTGRRRGRHHRPVDRRDQGGRRHRAGLLGGLHASRVSGVRRQRREDHLPLPRQHLRRRDRRGPRRAGPVAVAGGPGEGHRRSGLPGMRRQR